MTRPPEEVARENGVDIETLRNSDSLLTRAKLQFLIMWWYLPTIPKRLRQTPKYLVESRTHLFAVLILIGYFTVKLLAYTNFESILTYTVLPTSTNPLQFWTFVGSIFAHLTIIHACVNVMILLAFGPYLERILGRERYTYAVLGIGGLAAFVQLLPPMLMGWQSTSVIGASGAVAGVIGMLSVYKPETKIPLFFVIPIPFWLLGPLYIWFSLALLAGGGFMFMGIAHIAHIVGAFSGMLLGAWWRFNGVGDESVDMPSVV